MLEGTFDLPHYGHQGAIKNAKKAAAQHFQLPLDAIDLVIGITDLPEAELKTYKRQPIYSVDEKIRQMEGFADVHEVIRMPALFITMKFLRKNRIDLVAAGSDYIDPVRRDLYYLEPFQSGIFINFDRTEGISTTEILRRAVHHVIDDLAERVSAKLGSAERKRQLKVIQNFSRTF